MLVSRIQRIVESLLPGSAVKGVLIRGFCLLVEESILERNHMIVVMRLTTGAMTLQESFIRPPLSYPHHFFEALLLIV